MSTKISAFKRASCNVLCTDDDQHADAEHLFFNGDDQCLECSKEPVPQRDAAEFVLWKRQIESQRAHARATLCLTNQWDAIWERYLSMQARQRAAAYSKGLQRKSELWTRNNYRWPSSERLRQARRTTGVVLRSSTRATLQQSYSQQHSRDLAMCRRRCSSYVSNNVPLPRETFWVISPPHALLTTLDRFNWGALLSFLWPRIQQLSARRFCCNVKCFVFVAFRAYRRCASSFGTWNGVPLGNILDAPSETLSLGSRWQKLYRKRFSKAPRFEFYFASFCFRLSDALGAFFAALRICRLTLKRYCILLIVSRNS